MRSWLRERASTVSPVSPLRGPETPWGVAERAPTDGRTGGAMIGDHLDFIILKVRQGETDLDRVSTLDVHAYASSLHSITRIWEIRSGVAS